MTTNSSIAMQRIYNDTGAMKKWLDKHGFFHVVTDDNDNVWELLWETHTGSYYIVRGARNDDPVRTSFSKMKEILWEMCECPPTNECNRQ